MRDRAVRGFVGRSPQSGNTGNPLPDPDHASPEFLGHPGKNISQVVEVSAQQSFAQAEDVVASAQGKSVLDLGCGEFRDRRTLRGHAPSLPSQNMFPVGAPWRLR